MLTPLIVKRFSVAQRFYQSLGFPHCEVPWAVSTEAIDITLPSGATAVPIKNDHLVGSAEQSFLYLMLMNLLPKGKHQSLTPCFRDEPIDELHQLYFMKLELIDTLNVNQHGLEYMLDCAESFFTLNCGIEVDRVRTRKGWDILDHKTGIELGSYGIRSHEKVGGWVYGTGLAEPRLSKVIERNGNR